MNNPAPKHRAPSPSALPKAARKARARLKRRWPRRTLIAANGLVLACIAVTASAYAYVQHEINQIPTLPSGHVVAPGQSAGGGPTRSVPEADGLKAENILLIGNETRQGLTPAEQVLWGSSLTYNG
ncbi:MAG TPA: hypothetical protein VME46_06985, partial [Acidimicrobiales bacterium]|nr:hypothetical protein [Acidimicrobiales bacterium]